ncbi:major histocompatibility complex class I-related gene protein-like isoform X1 [Salarias fasciatus]|uniref:major histocompatibility complex class I-related gene protein-like isoform X1 n=1 Tax=Salarias fasciatus TaxID=181472 RepID=UPI0011768136|nr:major histocompatibility complex class I-related gene protein-like isoform X1 [Salarias fasciatus]
MRIQMGYVTMKLSMVLFLLGIPTVAPVLHSLKFCYTVTSDLPNVPEFVAVYVVDEVQTIHYDSNTKRAVPKQDWVNNVTEDDPTFWDDETERLKGNHLFFKAIIESGLQRLNIEGRHVVQGSFGCDWDDVTDEMNIFSKFGYEGEDFISLDLKTQTWIALSQQAVVVKEMLEDDKSLLVFLKNYLNHEFSWLKKFLNYGKSLLMRKDLPSVSLLQKTPSSPLTCHATGFYPDRADLFWKKDEEELHEDVVRGEILPNHDGSFQMSADLDLSGLKDEDWGRYSCVFQLAGVQEDVITPLDKRVILTNWREKRSSVDGFPTAAVVGAVVAVLLLLAGCITGLFLLWRRNSHGFRCANSSESSPPPGEDPAVKKETSERQTMLESRGLTETRLSSSDEH